METLLEFYSRKKNALEQRHETLCPEEYWLYQELSYRVYILEAIAFLERTAPVTTDIEVIKAHYIAFDALVSHIQAERRYADSPDETVQKRRETAYASLSMIQRDYRRRFSGYLAETAEQYSADIEKTIWVVLPAWAQYRNSLLEIKRDEEALA